METDGDKCAMVGRGHEMNSWIAGEGTLWSFPLICGIRLLGYKREKRSSNKEEGQNDHNIYSSYLPT